MPTAIRLAVARQLADEVHPAVRSLVEALRELAARTADVVKAGRTHLMDATPVTLGQEADAGPGCSTGALARSRADVDVLGELRSAARPSAPASTPARVRAAVIAALAAETGLPLRPTANPMSTRAGKARWPRRRPGYAAWRSR